MFIRDVDHLICLQIDGSCDNDEIVFHSCQIPVNTYAKKDTNQVNRFANCWFHKNPEERAVLVHALSHADGTCSPRHRALLSF